MTPEPVARYRRVCACLDAGEPIPPADAEWLAAGARAAIDGGRPLRAVFGLPARGGAGGLTRVARLAARDELLRTAHQQHFPGLEPRAAARAIVTAVSRRRRLHRPVAAPDVLDELAGGPPMPTERQVANILRVIHTPV